MLNLYISAGAIVNKTQKCTDTQYGLKMEILGGVTGLIKQVLNT